MTNSALHSEPRGSSTAHGTDPSTTDKIADKAEEIRDKASTAVDDAAQAARTGADELHRSLVQAGDKARDVAEKQPLLVAAGALAVGVALGMALSNRRS